MNAFSQTYKPQITLDARDIKPPKRKRLPAGLFPAENNFVVAFSTNPEGDRVKTSKLMKVAI